MNNFTFYSPTYFAFGKDTENDAGKYVKRFGGTKVLIHYGGGSVVRSGLLGRVKKSLDDCGISYIELGGVRPNPRSGLVYEGIELGAKEEDIERMAESCVYGDGRPGTISGFVTLDKEDVMNIYRMML